MNVQHNSMTDNNLKCHIFHGAPQKIQDDLSAFLESKKHLKISSLVQSQSIVDPGTTNPEILITITLLYSEADTEREHILGFNR